MALRRFGQGADTLPVALAMTEGRKENLENKYARILNNLVSQNLSAVEAFLAEQPADYDDTMTQLDHLQHLVDDTYPVTASIKRLAKVLNDNYHRVTLQRRQVPRYRPPLADYNWFLTQLYPKGGRIRISTLYDSYNALPSPKPLHILPQHLEDFLSALMGPSDETEASRAIFARVLDQVEQVGMPISQHELNAALGMAIREYYQDMTFTSKMMKQSTESPNFVVKLSEGLKQQQLVGDIKNEQTADDSSQNKVISPALESLLSLYKKIGMHKNNQDISTINILYRFALKTNDTELAAQASQPLRNGNIAPDRITFLIEIVEAGRRKSVNEVKQLYQEMCARNYVVDIVVMNVLLKALTNCNDRESAESVYSAILSQEPKNLQVSRSASHQVEKVESVGPGVSSESHQMNQLRLIDFVLHLTSGKNSQAQRSQVQNAMRFYPDKYTFGTMFGYYCLEAGDIQSAIRMLPTMHEHGESLTDLHYVMLYRGFARHAAESKQWSKSLLHDVTQQLLMQHQEQQRLKSETGISSPSLLTRKLCGNMLKAYDAVYWSSKSKVRIIRDEYEKGLQPVKISSGADDEDLASIGGSSPVPVQELVYRAAKQLLNLSLK
ncbi:uncharacterized protein SAPINGB_P006307 [Magnusiomyces paraingens]|uniref:Mitochondrial group I intron splicing factor CCM1 n=1 Tax=Magnusiomyces paraingens TaxID=2606893 RepID=A0A5E8C494_9ASCO|nr:uncharacterized protein SAPINGB_P006307 [Saprochaete ingens]VVT58634.1 unnamed protein product [Saprochaete ingens]